MSGSTPGIVYRTKKDVMYVTRDGASWRSELVDAVGIETYIEAPTLRFGPTGTPFVSYADETNWGKSYVARRGAEGWELLPYLDKPYELVMALDPSGVPEVLSTQAGGVFHTVARDGMYETDLVLSSKTEGGTVGVGLPALVIDAQGGRHVALRTAQGTLFYAHDAELSWTLVEVASGTSEVTPDIALDERGQVLIAYAEASQHAALATVSAEGTVTTTTLGAEPARRLALLSAGAGDWFVAWYPEAEDADTWHLTYPDGRDTQLQGPEAVLAVADGKLHAVYLQQHGFPMWDVCYATRDL